MANYPAGFNYVSGPWEMRLFPVHSTSTFVKRNPLSVDGSGRVIQYAAGNTSVVGIAMSDSSQSESVAGVNCVLVGIPGVDTVFAVKVQTGVATSSLTAYQAYNLEINTEHLRVDVDSTVTKIVQIVPRGDGTSDARSADSTVNVRFVRGILEPFGSVSTSIIP